MFNELDYKSVYIPTSLKIPMTNELKNYIKGYLIDSGIFDDYCRYRRAVYVFNNSIEEFDKLPNEVKYSLNFPKLYSLQDFHYYFLNQLFNCRRNKIYRLKQKIKYLFDNYECVFLTFTFTDEVLQKISSQTRRTYISRFLKKYDLYVANIDFGQDDKFTKREHYHAIVCGEVDYSKWKCGAINGERVRVTNSGKVATYLNKICSHAYKEGASSTRVIASRSFANYLR